MTSDAISHLYAIAGRQDSLATRSQALAAGVSRSTIERKVRRGEWQDVGVGVLLLGALEPDDHRRLRAATLALRDSVVSHESAATVQAFHYVPGDVLSVAVPVRSTHRFPGVRVRELTDLRSEDVIELDGLPVTTPVRTMFDLAATLRPGRYLRVVEDALAARRVTWEELSAISTELGRRGKPGSVLVRQAVERFGPGFALTTTELERRFRDLLERAGVGLPTSQFRPPWWQGTEGIVDFAYPDARIIIEVDGRRWHTRDSTHGDDAHRDNTAVLNGWRVLRFTWEDVVDRPHYVIATIVAALGQAA